MKLYFGITIYTVLKKGNEKKLTGTVEVCEQVNCERRGESIKDILTYSGACCGLSFMSVDPVRRQIRCLMLLHLS